MAGGGEGNPDASVPANCLGKGFLVLAGAALGRMVMLHLRVGLPGFVPFRVR